jgi:hypothetical protein
MDWKSKYIRIFEEAAYWKAKYEHVMKMVLLDPEIKKEGENEKGDTTVH